MSESEVIWKEKAWSSRFGGRFLIYTGPHLYSDLDRDAVRDYVRQRGAYGASWNYDWDCGDDRFWWSYICDTPGYSLDSIKKKVRYYVRKGLDACVVEKADPLWLGANAYDVYINATTRYTRARIVQRDEFVNNFRRLASEPGWEYFRVLSEGKLAAYSIVCLWGKTAQVSVAKFDPAYSVASPMYALYYCIAHHYLTEMGFTDVDNGCHPFVHDTNIGTWLERMGWRKAYCRIGLHLAKPMRSALWLARLLKRPFLTLMPGRYAASLEGLLAAQQVARRCR